MRQLVWSGADMPHSERLPKPATTSSSSLYCAPISFPVVTRLNPRTTSWGVEDGATRGPLDAAHPAMASDSKTGTANGTGGFTYENYHVRAQTDPWLTKASN